MSSNSTMIRKLQMALNTKGQRITYHTTQFYSEDQKRPVTQYRIMQAIPIEGTRKNRNVEIFSAYSQIQCVLFLRDLWFKINGMPIPEDNPIWNEKKLAQKQMADNNR